MSDTPIRYRLKVTKTQVGPNGMWSVHRPDLGMVGDGYIFEVLARNVKDYRRANGIPIGLEFEDELEQVLCAQHPELAITDDPRGPVDIRPLRMNDVLLGTKVMVRFLASGMKVVSQQEANRRAAICNNCTLNIPFAKACGGGLCGELLEIVNRVVGNNKTGYDGNLHSCAICKCLLQAAIWIPLQTQVPPLSDFQKAQFENVPTCWKKQSLLDLQPK
jgi:hypothetical protein